MRPSRNDRAQDPRRARILRLILGSLAVASPCAGGDPREERVAVAELSPEAERAIDRGLAYLADRQNGDGSWGRTYRAAMTGLSLMAFMVQGHFPERGPYGGHLDRAVAYLIAQGKAGGGYMGQSMYEHALATLALSEVWGMTDREGIRDILKQAVEVILRSQSSEGGWRYQPRPTDADISITVMQIVALASANEAGIHIPSQIIDRAKAYVARLQNRDDGGFGYQSAGRSGFARSAAGVMSLQLCGERDTPAVDAGLEYLFRNAPDAGGRGDHYFYGQYYAVQAMYQAGESHYRRWYPRARDALLAQQKPDGGWDGGYDAAYGTCMAILVLGVPYRFLPIYQR
ncbi:MAG: terpene cyclase/mutase family protein [Planctomycetes bacterium]|nr:terpene cyclase/mutase family protein [Planctomycetota bacterium]